MDINEIRKELERRKKEILNDKSLDLKVPKVFKSYNPYVLKAKETLERDPWGTYRCSDILSTKRGELNIAVTKPLIRRTLIFTDHLLKVCKQRGINLQIDYDSRLVSENNYCSFKIMERSKIVNDGKNNWDSRSYVPTGKLLFKIDRYGDKEWIDGKRMLEDQIPDIIAWLEYKDEEARQWKIESQRQEEIRRIEQERLAEIQRQNELEQKKIDNLLYKAKKWEESILIKSYLENHERFAIENNLMNDEFREWLDWGKNSINHYI